MKRLTDKVIRTIASDMTCMVMCPSGMGLPDTENCMNTRCSLCWADALSRVRIAESEDDNQCSELEDAIEMQEAEIEKLTVENAVLKRQLTIEQRAYKKTCRCHIKPDDGETVEEAIKLHIAGVRHLVELELLEKDAQLKTKALIRKIKALANFNSKS